MRKSFVLMTCVFVLAAVAGCKLGFMYDDPIISGAPPPPEPTRPPVTSEPPIDRPPVFVPEFPIDKDVFDALVGDVNLRAAIWDRYGNDSTNQIELLQVVSIPYTFRVSDIYGLEYLPNLTELHLAAALSGSEIQYLDFGYNPKLTKLTLNDFNRLERVHLDNNMSLAELNVENNALTALTVNSPVLTKFSVRNNPHLQYLDVSETALTELIDNRRYGGNGSYIYEGNLSHSNNIETLIARAMPNLVTLQYPYDGNYIGTLTNVDVTYSTALHTLNVWNNQLTSLDVTRNTALHTLNVWNNQLTSLDVTRNTALQSLSAGNNQLTSLDVTRNTALQSLSAGNNQLTSLDVTRNTALQSLTVNNNQLTNLDVTRNTALQRLWAYDNQLTSFVTHSTALVLLDVENNRLTSLDVSRSRSLSSLWITNNPLTYIDLRNNLGIIGTASSGGYMGPILRYFGSPQVSTFTVYINLAQNNYTAFTLVGNVSGQPTIQNYMRSFARANGTPTVNFVVP